MVQNLCRNLLSIWLKKKKKILCFTTDCAETKRIVLRSSSKLILFVRLISNKIYIWSEIWITSSKKKKMILRSKNVFMSKVLLINNISCKYGCHMKRPNSHINSYFLLRSLKEFLFLLLKKILLKTHFRPIIIFTFIIKERDVKF